MPYIAEIITPVIITVYSIIMCLQYIQKQIIQISRHCFTLHSTVFYRILKTFDAENLCFKGHRQ